MANKVRFADIPLGATYKYYGDSDQLARIRVEEGGRQVTDGRLVPIGAHSEGTEYVIVSQTAPVPTSADSHTPAYYRIPITVLGIEIQVMDILDALGLNFNRGCVIKYVCRAGKKSPSTELEDLKKARNCLDREIKRLESACAKTT